MYIFCLVVLCLTFIDYKAERNSCKVGINYEFMWVLAESQQSFQRMLENLGRFSVKVKNSNLTENVSIPLQTWHKIHKHQYKLGQLSILVPANHSNTSKRQRYFHYRTFKEIRYLKTSKLFDVHYIFFYEMKKLQSSIMKLVSINLLIPWCPSVVVIITKWKIF